MEIKVLGSGSSGNCYKISDGKTALLIECGIPITQIKKQLDYRLRDIAGCLISHEHGDHRKSWRSIVKAMIPLYMTRGTMNGINADIGEIEAVFYLKPFIVGSFSIIPFELKHDAKEPSGFYIRSNATGENLLYITDTCYVEDTFGALTHIMIEINYNDETLEANIAAGILHPTLARRIKKTHFSLDRAKRLLKANDLSKVRSIHIIHISSSNADVPKIKREIQEVTGKEIIIC